MKTKNVIILVCLVIIGLFVWGYFSRSGTVASVQGVSVVNISKNKLIAVETSYDFGVISMKNGNVQGHMAVFSRIEKWRYVWQKQLRKNDYDGFCLSWRVRYDSLMW